VNAAFDKPGTYADVSASPLEIVQVADEVEDATFDHAGDTEVSVAEPTRLAAEETTPGIDEKSQLSPSIDEKRRLRLPRMSEILRSGRVDKFPVQARKQTLAPPSLRAVGNFRERTAFDILQTLAEKEETEQSEISSEEPPKKKIELKTAQFQVAEIAQRQREIPPVPSSALAAEFFKEVRKQPELRVAGSRNLVIPRVERNHRLHGGLAKLEIRAKPAPRLKQEVFRESQVHERTVSLALGNTEKTEMVVKGRPLGLELFEHVRQERDHALTEYPRRIKLGCDCPIHRHKVRIASTSCG
jgi:hypothetical protein